MFHYKLVADFAIQQHGRSHVQQAVVMLNEKRVQNVLRVTFSSVIRAQYYTKIYNCYYLLIKFYSKAVYSLHSTLLFEYQRVSK